MHFKKVGNYLVAVALKFFVNGVMQKFKHNFLLMGSNIFFYEFNFFLNIYNTIFF